jgi:hypothetical protein
MTGSWSVGAESPLLAGPIESPLTARLAEVLECTQPRREDVVAAVRSAPRFHAVHNGRTVQGYPWLCVLEFRRASTGGKIFVALPGVSGRPQGGPRVDCPPRVYVAGEVGDQDIAAALVVLCSALSHR